MRENKLVAYFRVSTSKQGRDGLGIEAQRDAVSALVHSQGSRVLRPYATQTL